MSYDVLMFRWRSQNKWRATQHPRKRKLKNLSSKPGLISETSGSGEKVSGVKCLRVQVVINEIESANIIADLKTSYSITRAKLQTHFEVLGLISTRS